MNKTILIIDDDKMLRDSIAVGIRKEKFNAITSESAENAIEILNRISVDAIILDRMMTGIDGLSFLKTIRADNNNTPVIMLTAMSGSENTIDGLSSGANDYLAKPFQLRELILRLNNIIKNKDEIKNILPIGLKFLNDEFFIHDKESKESKIIALSGEEKKLLSQLVSPVGNIVHGSAMVVKRLRNKLNGVLSNIDIITVRGMGYKLVQIK